MTLRLPALAVGTALAVTITACGEARDPPPGPRPPTTADQSLVSPSTDADLDAVIGTGESIYLRGEFDSARTLWTSALRRARGAADSVREARILTWLGLVAYRKGGYREARRLGEEALALKLGAGLPAELTRSYNALGLLAWNEGRLEDATALFRRASQTARAAGDQTARAKAANNLALVHTELGRFAEAQAGFLEARRSGEQLGDARIEGGALANLGMLAVQLGDPQAAIEHLGRARERYRSIGYMTGEQNALGQLGTAYDALGEPGLALAALDSALAVSRRQGLRQEEASNLELIAGLHRQAGDLPRALRLYEEANRLNGELGLEVEKGGNLRSAAEVHLTLGRLDLARRQVAEALRIHRVTGAPLQELRDLLLLADVASQADQPVEAGRLLRDADRLARVLDARTARVEVALARATIAERAGDPRAVLKTIQLTQRDLARGGYGTEWQAAALRARAHAKVLAWDSAAAAGREAVVAIERVRRGYSSVVLRASWAVERSAPYAELVDVLLRQDQTEEALEVADASRSRALLEHLAATNDPSMPARSTVNALAEGEALLRRIDTLVSRLDALEETPVAERDSLTRVQLQGISASLTDTRAEYEALLVRTTELDVTGTALLGGRRVVSREVREALRPGEALVEYFAGPERLVVFVATGSGIRSLTVPIARVDLARRVRLARDLLGRGAGGAETEAMDVLTALHEALIAPLERAGLLTGTRRILIVPHGSLAYLPFGALWRESSGRFLIEDYALLQLPSAAALGAIRAGSQRLEVPLAKPIGFAPYPDRLRGSREEVRSLRRRLRGAEIREGPRATELSLRQRLSLGGVVHVASHGIMNPRNPMFSRVELARGTGGPADDGRLEVHELLGMRVAAPLVFLSGCETGVGAAWLTDFAHGEDYATLAQAFLYAGARNVLATLWPIADRGAAVFADRFYAQLGQMEPPEALAAAQRELLGNREFGHPFYWAAYVLSGDGGFP